MEPPDALVVEEYRALRATIRERGTLRLIVTAITFLAWGALVVAVTASLVMPVMALVPLVVLAAGFEVIFAAHVGVERIGRYLQAHYEPGLPNLPAWEHTAMRIGRPPLPSAGIDPLLTPLFGAAAALNLIPIALQTTDGPVVGGFPVELAIYGLAHAAFLLRIIRARRFSATQRIRDLEVFTGDRATPA